MTKPAFALLLALALASTPLGGYASSGGAAPPPPGPSAQTASEPSAPGDPADPDELPPVSAPPGLTAMDRVQSAVDGMILGVVIGAQAGPYGMAVGAATMLIYSAITGHVPLRGSSGPSRGGGGYGDPESDEQEREEEIEREPAGDRGEGIAVRHVVVVRQRRRIARVEERPQTSGCAGWSRYACNPARSSNSTSRW